MSEAVYVRLPDYQEYPNPEMEQRAQDYYREMQRRRTVRGFSERPVSQSVIDLCIRTAGTAPSGANQQPWHFAVIRNPEMKSKIRQAAEKEERDFYHRRAPKEWLKAIEPLGTNADKPFLEIAPCLIAIFVQRFGLDTNEQKYKHYHPSESVGIATGMLISAIHHAGLVSLTHTPSPMDFLTQILRRPRNERTFMLLAVGYPAQDVMVPDLKRKTLEEIRTEY